LTALDDEEVHEVSKYDFAFYVNDTMTYPDEITKWDKDMGRVDLQKLIAISKPRMICFVGVRNYLHFFKKRGVVDHGLQPRPYRYNCEGEPYFAELFILPGTMPVVSTAEEAYREK
jgi:hypothetical protein